MMRLSEKVCVVTGAARGIGRTVLETFLANGARAVVACDVNECALRELEGRERVRPITLDVTNPGDVEGLMARIRSELGRVDVLVNNAGITRDALITKMTDGDWDAVIAVNLKGPFNMTRAVAPLMYESGSGSIVNVASVVGIDGNIGQSNYAATKAGLIGMTKTWAKELARKGAKIRVNAVAPGYINTEMMRSVPEKVIEGVVAKTTLGRLGEPSEVADAILFLASDESSFVTGQVIRVDGGLVL